MPTWKQVIETYGEEMAAKMRDNEWLDCITCTILPSGEIDIPQRDIDIAFRAANGGIIGDMEWD
ncbi:MAG: hypothetical protein WC343_10500 [Bacilli bacterium]